MHPEKLGQNKSSEIAIQNHFIQFLGADVSVAFAESKDLGQVLLYRPDRLSDGFVEQAYEALAQSSPQIAAIIEELVVSFETPFGRIRRGIALHQPGRIYPCNSRQQ